MDELDFSRNADNRLKLLASQDTKLELARRIRDNPCPVARSIVNGAGIDLASEAKELAFATKRPYEECVNHLLATSPMRLWFMLALQPITDNEIRFERDFGIVITDASS